MHLLPAIEPTSLGQPEVLLLLIGAMRFQVGRLLEKNGKKPSEQGNIQNWPLFLLVPVIIA